MVSFFSCRELETQAVNTQLRVVKTEGCAIIFFLTPIAAIFYKVSPSELL